MTLMVIKELKNSKQMNALKVLTFAICIKDGCFLMLNQFCFWLYSERLRHETYRKVLQILIMKNYAVLVANFKVETCLCFEIIFAVSALCSKTGCDWHNFNMAMGKKRYKRVFARLYLCYEAFF